MSNPKSELSEALTALTEQIGESENPFEGAGQMTTFKGEENIAEMPQSMEEEMEMGRLGGIVVSGTPSGKVYLRNRGSGQTLEVRADKESIVVKTKDNKTLRVSGRNFSFH